MSKKNKIKVVPGKGKNIKISDIKEHLEIEKPQDEIVEKDKIIILLKKIQKNKDSLNTVFIFYIASFCSSSLTISFWSSSPSCLTTSKLDIETSYATLVSDVPSSYFFSYVLD